MIPAAQTVNEMLDNPEPISETSKGPHVQQNIIIHTKG
jgi:hypothetical protein